MATESSLQNGFLSVLTKSNTSTKARGGRSARKARTSFRLDDSIFYKTNWLSIPPLSSLKMPKESRRKTALKHDPLAVQMSEAGAADTGVLSVPGKRQKMKRQQPEEVRTLLPSAVQPKLTVLLQSTLNAKTSRKVLEMARDQQDDLAREDDGDWDDEEE